MQHCMNYANLSIKKLPEVKKASSILIYLVISNLRHQLSVLPLTISP